MSKKIMLAGCILAALFCSMQMNAAVSVSSATATAQQPGRVSGVVSDKMGPVAGASIQVKGTKTGVATDLDGNFTITGVNVGDVLVISYVGYSSQEIKYTGQPSISVVFDDTLALEEVVVVAYGTAKKSSFTGSASVVKADQLEKTAGAGFVEALQGMSAGVMVVNNEGAPGSDSRIQIRGIASMSGNTQPLYIIDGMPYDGTLNSINPSDIESMTVLKDAAASSLYGSRAANGVVVITTKKGKEGKPVVNFKASWSTSDMAVPFPTKIDPYQELLYSWTAAFNDFYYVDGMSMKDAGDKASLPQYALRDVNPRTNSAGQTVYVTPFKNLSDPTKYVLHDGQGHPYTNPELQMVWDETDWNKILFKHKLRQEYGVDLSGASADGKSHYYVSAGFLDDNGYSNHDYYKRYTFRASADSQVTDWLKLGGSVQYSYSRRTVKGYNRSLIFTNRLNSPYLRNEDNTDWYTSATTGYRTYDYGENSANFFGIHVLSNGDYWNNPNSESFNSNEYTTVNSQFFAEAKLPFDINFRSAVNLDDDSANGYSHSSAVNEWGQVKPYGSAIIDGGGDASRSVTKTMSVTWNNVLHWTKMLGNHSVDLMAGQELYSFNQQYSYAYGAGIMAMNQFELANTTRDWSTNSNKTRYSLLSFFAKADYNYDGRYYASASFRRDGSSRFSPANRWGNFWSVGASWRISKEEFMENVSWLNNLTLRGSYGTSGNDKLISRNASNGSMGSEIFYGYQEYYQPNNFYGEPGYIPSTIATPDLRWEKNKQLNVALDFSTLSNRLGGTIEWYTRNSEDLLYYKDLPLSAQVGGATGINTNLGNVVNRGFEFTLNAIPVQTRDFMWKIDANISTLHNEVTYLPGGAYNYSNRVANYRLEEGKSLFEFYMTKNAGINPDTGNLMYWMKDGDKWVKTEDWGAASSADNYQWCGSAIPTAFGSITNTFAWKGFDLSMMWYGSFGAKLYDYMWYEGATGRVGVGLSTNAWGKVWTGPGDTAAEFPKWSHSNSGQTRRGSDFFLFNNDFARLRNLMFGYTVPKKAVQKVGLSNLRVYVSGDNLCTLGSAAKRNTDPETGLLGNNYNGNAVSDNGVQSSRRVYLFGVQLSF
ncbi:MAG: TonB-dependent receptor [Bacteroidales bacterium]|nr:TonB-dependent receptor [Candidatus Cryptobacteroides onthequi]